MIGPVLVGFYKNPITVEILSRTCEREQSSLQLSGLLQLMSHAQFHSGPVADVCTSYCPRVRSHERCLSLPVPPLRHNGLPHPLSPLHISPLRLFPSAGGLAARGPRTPPPPRPRPHERLGARERRGKK